MRFIVILYFFK